MVPIILKSIIIICNINTDWLNVNPKRGTFKKDILYIAEKPLPKALIRYRSYITFKRKQYSLGCYKKLEEAIEARKKAEENIYGGFLEWYKGTYPKEWEIINKKQD